jgi:predicted alpha/beta hydrolase family esterase
MENVEIKTSKVLILAGLNGSGPLHWQCLWAQNSAYSVVEQHDWRTPLRGDWLARLDDVIADLQAPIYLVAHSLACIQVAAWANKSVQADKVKGALLVAPSDVEAPPLTHALSSWRPVEMKALPFDSILVARQNDPFCSVDRAMAFAKAWGSTWKDVGCKGHLNADANLGDWPEGQALLNDLMKEEHGY